MKKAGLLLLSLCLLGGGFAGRGSAAKGELTGTVTVGGSPAAEWCMNVLLESFTFEKPYATVTYSPSSSRYGISGIATGMLDIGVTSFLPADMPPSIRAVPFAREPIAVVVHRDNPVQSFTRAQLKAILDGEISNWSQLGWQDREIVLFGRRETSGTRFNFETAIGAAGAQEYDAVFSGSGAVAAQVAGNPYAIGYTSGVPANPEVASAVIEGVAPCYETLVDGSYPFTQTFYLLLDDSRQLGTTAQAFLEYLGRPGLAEQVEKTGALYLLEEGP